MSKNVPLLTLPTADYEKMKEMNNRSLISVLRTAVLAGDRIGRFSPRPPAEHDAYKVERGTSCIDVHLMTAGEEIFCCKFVPADEY